MLLGSSAVFGKKGAVGASCGRFKRFVAPRLVLISWGAPVLTGRTYGGPVARRRPPLVVVVDVSVLKLVGLSLMARSEYPIGPVGAGRGLGLRQGRPIDPGLAAKVWP